MNLYMAVHTTEAVLIRGKSKIETRTIMVGAANELTRIMPRQSRRILFSRESDSVFLCGCLILVDQVRAVEFYLLECPTQFSSSKRLFEKGDLISITIRDMVDIRLLKNLQWTWDYICRTCMSRVSSHCFHRCSAREQTKMLNEVRANTGTSRKGVRQTEREENMVAWQRWCETSNGFISSYG